MFVHPGCTNSGLRRNPGEFPESVCVPESPTGPVTCLRLLGLLPSANIFAVCSLHVKLLNIRGDYARVARLMPVKPIEEVRA